MTPNEIKRRYPHASSAFIRANTDSQNKSEGIRKTSELEPRSLARTLATPQIQERSINRVIVRITSVRRRLIDEDNICEKFIIDGLRYAGLLLSDAPDKTHIQTSQRKCKKEEFEHTEIEIIYP